MIKAIQEQDEIDKKVGKAFELISDSWVLFNTANKKHAALMELLRVVTGDTEGWIEWWLYEDVDKVVSYDGKQVKLSTVEKLYDFLADDAVVG